MRKIGAELILLTIGSGLAWSTWATITLYSVQAKADRVVAIEKQVDYIYKYLIENPKITKETK